MDTHYVWLFLVSLVLDLLNG